MSIESDALCKMSDEIKRLKQEIESLQRVHEAAKAYRGCHWIKKNRVELDKALALLEGSGDVK